MDYAWKAAIDRSQVVSEGSMPHVAQQAKLIRAVPTNDDTF